ncbi:hypothetical protein HRbin22_00889 [Candidatus Thermoflexus japonica]|uniref:DUF2029 domain-containing protein n=1 Tax=Candidatus Thermoflexus japonica TaxID=2035417 RepID=A0A2H5Y5Q7_9CHLR|nr:hypothetical protein HRbin22_00889 [Candidatus Thermoflexus japonica]
MRLSTLSRIPQISRLVFAVHLGLALGYIGLVLMAFARGETWRADFTAHYTGARMVWEGQGAMLYNLKAQAQRQREILGGRYLYDGLLPYHHPPFVALALSPLAAMSLRDAFALWAVLTLLLWVGFLGDLIRWTRSWSAAARALTVSAVAALPGFLFSFLLGTFTIWTLVALWAFYRALREGREGWAGLFLALASAHPQATLFPALGLIFARRWKALAVFLASGVLLIGISAAVLGSAVWIEYLAVLGRAAMAFGRQGIDPEAMINLKGLLARLLGPTRHAWVNGLSALGLALGVLAMGMLWRRPWRGEDGDFERRLSGTFAMGLFLTPHANPQDGLLIALPGLLFYRFLQAAPEGGTRTGRTFERVAVIFPMLWLAERFALGSNESVPLGTIALIAAAFWMGSLRRERL